MATGKGIDVLTKRGITNESILEAMRKVPRERFYSEDPRKSSGAHSSRLDGLTITPPEVIAQMVEALELAAAGGRPGNILQIGTGTGYVPAILSELSTSVFSVERDPDVARFAQGLLAELGYKNVQVLYGNNLKQYAANGPYDAILVSASMASLPQRLAKRLKVGGRLVAPIGKGRKQRLVRMTRVHEERFREEELGELRVTPLLGDILVEMGVVDRDELEMVALEADVKGKKLGEALLEGQHVEESDIYRALATQQEMKLYTAHDILAAVDRDVFHSIPRAFLIHNRIIPIHKRDGMLHVATTDSRLSADELAQALGLLGIEVGLVTPSDYQLVWSSLERPEEAEAKASTSKRKKVEAPAAFDASTIALLEQLLQNAVDKRASDLHFDRHGDGVTVRMRVDGVLQPMEMELTPATLEALIHLIKVSARMDPGTRRIPQAGTFQRRIGERVFDVRARTQPVLFGGSVFFGETAVLRLLPTDTAVPHLEELGFGAEFARTFADMLERPSGIVLLVGPTSSGKSTTLYSGLQTIADRGQRKIVAIEDPPTYTLPGVQYLRVDEEQGFGPAQAVDAAIHDDADVLLVGDIEDAETARQVFRAAQAGHLVLTSVHGKEAVDGVRRLLGFGLDPNVVSSELLGVVAQRLVTRIRPECRREDTPDPELLAPIFPDGIPDDFTCFDGGGCDDGKGTLGRVAVWEHLPIDRELRREIADGATVETLRQSAAQRGNRTMLDNALQLVQEGVIPQDELRWVPNH